MAEQQALESPEVREAVSRGERRLNKARRAAAVRDERWDALVQAWRSGDDSVPDSPEIVELCRQGIPDRLRNEVWPLLIGNQLRITTPFFTHLCDQADSLWPQLLRRRKAELELTRRPSFGASRGSLTPAVGDDSDGHGGVTPGVASAEAAAGRRASDSPRGHGSAGGPAEWDGVELFDDAEEDGVELFDDAEEDEDATPDQAGGGGAGGEEEGGGGAERAAGALSGAGSRAAGDEALPEAGCDAVGDDAAARAAAGAARAAAEAAALAAEEREEAAAVSAASAVLASVPVFGSQMTMVCIDLDTERTFPELPFFRPGMPEHRALRAVLSAFAVYRPDLGYVQGMNNIAATVLLHVDSRPHAFSAFANLMLRPALFEVYGEGVDKSSTRFLSRMDGFSAVLRRTQPAVAARLDGFGLEPSMFLVKWTRTLFTIVLPQPLVERIWDRLLMEHDGWLWQACAGIVHAMRRVILSPGMDTGTVNSILMQPSLLYDDPRLGQSPPPGRRDGPAADGDDAAGLGTGDAGDLSDARWALGEHEPTEEEQAEARRRILATIPATDEPLALDAVMRAIDSCGWDDELFDLETMRAEARLSKGRARSRARGNRGQGHAKRQAASSARERGSSHGSGDRGRQQRGLLSWMFTGWGAASE